MACHGEMVMITMVYRNQVQVINMDNVSNIAHTVANSNNTAFSAPEAYAMVKTLPAFRFLRGIIQRSASI